MVKEIWAVWKAVFSKPEEGFRRITPETPIGIPLLIITVVLFLAGVLLIPVATSEAYREACLRAYGGFIERSTIFTTPEARQAALEKVASPFGRSFELIRLLIGPILNFLAAAVLSGAFISLIGFIFRSRIKFAAAVRVFIFSWPVLAWQALLTGVIILFSDYQGALGRVQTLTALRYALSVPFSLSIFIPLGSVIPPLLLAIDFVTNLFNIIFYVLLATGIRVMSGSPAAWKAWFAAVGIALCHFIFIALPVLAV